MECLDHPEHLPLLQLVFAVQVEQWNRKVKEDTFGFFTILIVEHK